MSETVTFDSIPDDWPALQPDTLERALTATRVALQTSIPRGAVERLTDYYDRDGNYAGATFVDLDRGDPDAITPADLVAVGLLRVTVSARATRRLLEPGPDRARVGDALRAVRDRPLELATPDDLAAIDHLHAVLVEILGKDPWVTASKLSARKRPETIPVRDHVVRTYLGLEPLRRRRIDWQVYRGLVGHADVIATLDDVAAQVREGARASGRRVVLDRHRLRLLDVALWTFASESVART